MSRSRTTTLTLAAALVTLAGVSGCNNEDAARQAVADADHEFSAIAAGDGSVFVELESPVFSEVAANAGQYAGSETPYEAAASIALANAKLGEAASSTIDAARSESECLRRGRIIRSWLSEWQTMSSLAEAASTFDPSAEIAQLESLKAGRQADADRYAEERATIENEISGLQASVDALRAKAHAQRQMSGELDLEIPRVSATRAAELAAQSREHTLRADQFELEAVRIEGRIGQLKPYAAEIGLTSDKANAQIQLLAEAQDNLRDRARRANEDAAEARGKAAAARDEVVRLTADFTEFRDLEVAGAYRSVESAIRDARSAIRDARQLLRPAASEALANAEETAGQVATRRSAGHLEAASLYEAISEAGISGQHSTLVEQERQLAAEAKEASDQAFSSAADALRGLRARGDAGDRVDAAVARLELLAGIEPEVEESFDDYDDESWEEDGQDTDDFETEPDSEEESDG